MLIVTAANEPYFPGVFALWNSIQKHSPGHDFMALIYGDLTPFTEAGIPCIQGPPVECERLPEGRHIANDPMYIRIQLPRMFDDERILWLDCDQIVIQPLDELATMDLGGYSCAMVPTDRGGVGGQFKDDPEFKSNSRAGCAGALLIETDTWNELEITEQCFAAMLNRTDLTFSFVVQSALNLVLDGDFVPLPECYQVFANRGGMPKDAKILHWVGNGACPWMKDYVHRSGRVGVVNSSIWDKYAD